MADLLAEAEAELYAADPDGFTARRSELAERAREAGEPAVAKKITALRAVVTATLDAAIADPEVAAGLGTLVRAARYAGFGPVPDGGFAPAPAPKKTKAPAETETEREARRREKIKEAERALADADRDLESATSAERELEDSVRRLEADLADARQRLAEARRRSYRAESRQQRAAGQLSRLQE